MLMVRGIVQTRRILKSNSGVNECHQYFWKAGMAGQVADITEEAMRRQADRMKRADKRTRAMMR